MFSIVDQIETVTDRENCEILLNGDIKFVTLGKRFPKGKRKLSLQENKNPGENFFFKKNSGYFSRGKSIKTFCKE